MQLHFIGCNLAVAAERLNTSYSCVGILAPRVWPISSGVGLGILEVPADSSWVVCQVSGSG
jgi:hypothetical protein